MTNEDRELMQPEQGRQHDYRTRYDRGCYKCAHGIDQKECDWCARQEQEPVAVIGNWGRVEWLDGVYPQLGDKLYSAPQRREWVGLTEEEVRKCFFRDDAPPSSPPYWWEYRNPDYRDIYALLDQALKEKNA